MLYRLINKNLEKLPGLSNKYANYRKGIHGHGRKITWIEGTF
jgi:hypothetical protein